jgi:mRNA deadenylase 3'-5' endonuclease subunit Ccr4
MYNYRLSDKREAGWPVPPKDNGNFFKQMIKKIIGFVYPYLEYLRILPDSKSITDPWSISQNRWNILITVKLQDKATKKSFAIGNYHMPCAYYAPMVMTIHTDLAARHIQRLAGYGTGKDGANKIPYILAGDWNIKPDGSSYRLLTTGQMDKGDPEWPTPKFGMSWEPSAQPMRSAYAASNGKEPDFTNFARIKEQEPFIDTLDYIFLSDEWKVKGVKPLVHRDQAGGPFPNLDRNEPSDHILIAADLEL